MSRQVDIPFAIRKDAIQSLKRPASISAHARRGRGMQGEIIAPNRAQQRDCQVGFSRHHPFIWDPQGMD